MKSRLIRILSSVMTVILIITAIPLSASAAPSFNQLVNASTEIIMVNEGNYTTVVRDDVGAVSLGKICWHATNALNLLKEIVALNPSQALSILGASLYNEIVISSSWEGRIVTKAEASALSVLLATSESRYVQDKTAWKYISEYVQHGIDLGITEPEALVFFADFENQNGRTGAANYYYEVMSKYGRVNLATLYECSSKNSRRTRTYNFCATVNWNDYSSSPSYETDTDAPEISNVAVRDLTSEGYTVSCDASDNEGVTAIYFAVFFKADGADTAKWYKHEGTDSAAFTMSISEFGGRSGDYCTYIYVFDAAGNYSYAELNVITVPEAEPEIPPLTVTVSANSDNEVGGEIRWHAAALNGSGNYQYEFNLYRDGILIARRDYLDYSDYSVTVEKTGSYHVIVNVRDTAAGTTATVTSPTTDIFTPITINSFTASETTALIYQTIVWTIDAVGGEGDLKYSYTVYRDDEIVFSSDFSDDYKFPYKIPDYGNYNVTVTVMDSRSQVVTMKSNDVAVMRPLSAENVAFSKAYAVAGQSVTCSADVLGGTGSFTCIFSIYCDGVLVMTSEQLDTSEFTFTVTQSGEYTAALEVTDADSTVTSASGGSMKADETAARGDANCDGKVNAFDARHALRCSAGLEKQEEAVLYAADVNSDGKITAADARLILRAVAQLETL